VRLNTKSLKQLAWQVCTLTNDGAEIGRDVLMGLYQWIFFQEVKVQWIFLINEEYVFGFLVLFWL
jgi:hypothetical protein